MIFVPGVPEGAGVAARDRVADTVLPGPGPARLTGGEAATSGVLEPPPLLAQLHLLRRFDFGFQGRFQSGCHPRGSSSSRSWSSSSAAAIFFAAAPARASSGLRCSSGLLTRLLLWSGPVCAGCRAVGCVAVEPSPARAAVGDRGRGGRAPGRLPGPWRVLPRRASGGSAFGVHWMTGLPLSGDVAVVQGLAPADTHQPVDTLGQDRRHAADLVADHRDVGAGCRGPSTREGSVESHAPADVLKRLEVVGGSISRRKRSRRSHVCHAGMLCVFASGVARGARPYKRRHRHYRRARGNTERERRTTCPAAKAKTRRSPPRPPRRLGPGRTGTGGPISWTFKFSTSTRPVPIRWTRTSITPGSSRPSTSTR